MPVKEIGDPRLQALFGASDPRDGGVRPAVRLPSKGVPPIFFVIGMLAFAVILLAVLNARRTNQAEPAVRGRAADAAPTSWDVPPLYIPPVQAPQTSPAPLETQKPAVQVAVAPAPVPAVRPAPQVAYMPQTLPQLGPPAASPAPPRVSTGALLVIDSGATGAAAQGGSGSPIAPAGQAITRMRASALANRSTTVPQGYLIPAVLETGFDSTKPGFARAVVSRDVRGFDGKNILIPRGSRLIGEYRSEVGEGQKRAIITWTRLIRPDGMTIAMDSPAVDTLGRGGVAASVNTHFFQRLGDALLQTTVGLGSALAQRRISGPIVVLPADGAATVGQALPTNSYVPTLTVPPGTNISVFVAHDLDFSAAGAMR
jgi:type IV secretion system protein VirB10